MDLTGAIQSFLTGTYTVSRRPRATFDSNGDPSIATATSLSVLASVQPATGRDLQRLPEGLRTQEVLAVYALAELRAGSATSEPDLITVDGEIYQVQAAERWNALGGYWKALVSKVGNG